MSNYPFIKIYACSEDVTDVDYLDIDYTTAEFFHIPSVTATADTNVDIYISNLTRNTARLNFSAKFTGTVKYTVIAKK